ncbi:protein CUP-SHAPED COTYLEDON 2 [Rosa sericea]
MADSKSTDAFPPGFRFHPSEQQLLSYYLSTRKPTRPYLAATIRSESCPTYEGANRPSYRTGVAIRTVTKGGKGTGTFILLGFRRRRRRSRDVGRGKVRLGTCSAAKGLFWAPGLALSIMTGRPTQPHLLIGYSISMLWLTMSRGSFVLCRIFSRSDSDFNSCANNDEVLMPKPETVSTTSNEQARVSQSRPAAAATPSPIQAIRRCIQASVPPSSLQQFFDLTGPLVILPSWPAQGPRPRGASMPYYGGPMIRQGQQPPVPPTHNIAPGVYHLPPGGNIPELLAPLPRYFLPPVPPVQSLPRSVPTVLTTALVNATPEERRNMLGEELFPLV